MSSRDHDEEASCTVSSQWMLDNPISFLGLPEQNTTSWVAKTTEIYFLTVWRLEVQDQGVGRFGFSCGFSPRLADDLVLYVHAPPTPLFFLFLWGLQSYTIRALPLCPFFTFITSFKGSVFKCSHDGSFSVWIWRRHDSVHNSEWMHDWLDESGGNKYKSIVL